MMSRTNNKVAAPSGAIESQLAQALEREGRGAAWRKALARQARGAARPRRRR